MTPQLATLYSGSTWDTTCPRPWQRRKPTPGRSGPTNPWAATQSPNLVRDRGFFRSAAEHPAGGRSGGDHEQPRHKGMSRGCLDARLLVGIPSGIRTPNPTHQPPAFQPILWLRQQRFVAEPAAVSHANPLSHPHCPDPELRPKGRTPGAGKSWVFPAALPPPSYLDTARYGSGAYSIRHPKPGGSTGYSPYETPANRPPIHAATQPSPIAKSATSAPSTRRVSPHLTTHKPSAHTPAPAPTPPAATLPTLPDTPQKSTRASAISPQILTGKPHESRPGPRGSRTSFPRPSAPTNRRNGRSSEAATPRGTASEKREKELCGQPQTKYGFARRAILSMPQDSPTPYAGSQAKNGPSYPPKAESSPTLIINHVESEAFSDLCRINAPALNPKPLHTPLRLPLHTRIFVAKM